MTTALDRIRGEVDPPFDHEAVWGEAIQQAARAAPPQRGSARESPAARMRRLREMIDQELVAFHSQLRVNDYAGDDLEAGAGARLVEVQVPLTLFPRRDHGFWRLECLVELSPGDNGGGGDGFQIVKLLPAPRSEVLAKAEIGAELELKTGAKLGLPSAFVPGLSVAQVAGKIYADVEAGPFYYEAVRACVETEIVRGTGARWRLEDPRRSEQIGVESHQLAVVVRVEQGSGPIDAAGYLQAYSETHWLTASVSGVWLNFKAAAKRFFQRGAPVEAYAEWPAFMTG